MARFGSERTGEAANSGGFLLCASFSLVLRPSRDPHGALWLPEIGRTSPYL
jgi:hypothetical protein